MTIKHFEDLKPNILFDFIDTWLKNKSEIKITEKIDGNYFAFGKKDNVFYIKTKNKKYTSCEEIPDLHFMSDFKKYFLNFSNIDFGLNDFELIGEMVPRHNHNVVQYDEAKILNGIFVVFEQSPNTINWEEKFENINQKSRIKLFAVPKKELNTEIPETYVEKLKVLIDCEELKLPARTPEQKNKKEALLNKIKNLSLEIKNLFLKDMPKSKFGDECEGLVFSFKNNVFKILDKEKFLQRKNNDWFYINEINSIEKEFINNVKTIEVNYSDKSSKDEANKMFISFCNLFSNNMKLLEMQFKKQIQNKTHKFFSSYKKEETELMFHITHKKIYFLLFNMKDDIEKRIKIVIEKRVEEQMKNNFYCNINSVIPNNMLHTTLYNALYLLDCFSSPAEFKIVGNKSKDFLGDIDVAVKKKFLKDVWNLSEDNFWLDLDNFLKQKNLKYKIIKNFKQFQIIAPLWDEMSNHANAFDEQGNQKNELGYVQIDFFVGDVNWITTIMSSSPKESKYKALYRNLLLISMFTNILIDSKKDKNIKYKIVLDTKEGLRITKRKVLLNKNNKEILEKLDDKLFSKEPDKITKLLFKDVIKWNDINSFEKLYALYKSDLFKYKQFNDKIDKEFLYTLKTLKQDIPAEIKNIL